MQRGDEARVDRAEAGRQDADRPEQRDDPVALDRGVERCARAEWDDGYTEARADTHDCAHLASCMRETDNIGWRRRMIGLAMAVVLADHLCGVST